MNNEIVTMGQYYRWPNIDDKLHTITSKIMDIIINNAKEKKLITSIKDIRRNVAISREVYRLGYEMLIEQLYPDNNCARPNETNIYTLYNRLKTSKKGGNS